VTDIQYICNCGKKYSHNSTLSQHKKKCIKYQEGKLLLEIVKDVKDMKQSLELLKQKDISTKIVATNTNSNNNNSNNNTIVINNFGREDLTYLSKPFLENCLYHMSRGIGCLTKEIYLNDKKPENQTIKATNIKSPYVKVMKDQKLIYKDKEEALNYVLWSHTDLLNGYYDTHEMEIKNKWSEPKLETVQNWLQRLQEEDKELWLQMKKDIFLILVNN
jgi:hypothetical protein